MFDVVFIDAGREATEKPDPRWPDGVGVDLRSSVIQKSCTRNVPYPAPRCGAYRLTCRRCGFTAVVTVAGRADDPRVVTMPCKARGLDS